MLIIAHRANINGPNRQTENSPDHIEYVIKNSNYLLEIDVRVKDNTLYLGHDNPEYRVSSEFLDHIRHRCIFHAKDPEAFNWLLRSLYHCFWHDNDDYTLTSQGIIWVYPGKLPINNSICVHKGPISRVDTQSYVDHKCKGICTDNAISVDQFMSSINCS